MRFCKHNELCGGFDPVGEEQNHPSELCFIPSLRVDFRRSRVTDGRQNTQSRLPDLAGLGTFRPSLLPNHSGLNIRLQQTSGIAVPQLTVSSIAFGTLTEA